jgi:hypothetical protein
MPTPAGPCVTILRNIRKVYIFLYEGIGALLTASTTTADDRDPVLDEKESYPMCTVVDHRPSRPIPPLHIIRPAYDAAVNSAQTVAGSSPSVSFNTPVSAPAPFGTPHVGPYPHAVTAYNMPFVLPASSFKLYSK